MAKLSIEYGKTKKDGSRAVMIRLVSGKTQKLMWQLPFLILLIVGTVLVIGQQRNTPYQHDSGMVFGTEYHITYQHGSNLHKKIEAELRKVDMSLSPFNREVFHMGKHLITDSLL